MGAIESLAALGGDWTDGRKNQGDPAPLATARPPVSGAGATSTATGSREPATGSNTSPTNEMLQELLSFQPIQHLNDKFTSDNVVMWHAGESKTSDEKIAEDLVRMQRDVNERWVPIYDLPEDEKVRELIIQFLTDFIEKGNEYVQSQVARAELCIRSSLDADDAWRKMKILLSITAAALDDSMDELFNLFIVTFESDNPALYHHFSSIGLEMDILAAAVTPIMWNLTVDNRSVSHAAALVTRIIECTSAEDVRREVVNATNGLLEVANTVERMPHTARHAVCKVFAECSRLAPAEVKVVLQNAYAPHVQLEKGRSHYRNVQIFSSKSTIRLVPGSVVAKLLTDLIKRCPDLEKPVKETVQLIAMWHVVFSTAKLQAARAIFSKALLEEIHTTTFDGLVTSFSGKLEFADSKAAVAVVDRCRRLPDTTGAIAYCQSLASVLNGELDATHDACKKVPKLTEGSLYAELVGYSETSILAGWQAAEKEVYDGYGAPIVAVLPGALGDLMMQDMEEVAKCQTAIVSAAFGVHAENANETAGTVHLRALHNKVLPKWVQKQRAAMGHESSGFVCKAEWSGGGSIYTLIRCQANTQDCLDDVLARIQDTSSWKDEVLVSAGVQVESIGLPEQVDQNDNSPAKLRKSQGLDQQGKKRKRGEPPK